jgi:hypothetical protein
MICLPVIKPDTDVLRKTYSPGKWAAITGKENLAVFSQESKAVPYIGVCCQANLFTRG